MARHVHPWNPKWKGRALKGGEKLPNHLRTLWNDFAEYSVNQAASHARYEAARRAGHGRARAAAAAAGGGDDDLDDAAIVESLAAAGAAAPAAEEDPGPAIPAWDDLTAEVVTVRETWTRFAEYVADVHVLRVSGAPAPAPSSGREYFAKVALATTRRFADAPDAPKRCVDFFQVVTIKDKAARAQDLQRRSASRGRGRGGFFREISGGETMKIGEIRSSVGAAGSTGPRSRSCGACSSGRRAAPTGAATTTAAPRASRRRPCARSRASSARRAARTRACACSASCSATRPPAARRRPRGNQIFNPTSMCDRFDARFSAVLRELDESNRCVQKSAESTSI